MILYIPEGSENLKTVEMSRIVFSCHKHIEADKKIATIL